MTEVERRDYELLGDAYMQKGLLADAVQAFETAAAKDKLITCGNACLEKNLFASAVQAFQAAGDNDKLIACGNACMQKGRLAEALVAFLAAGDTSSAATLALGRAASLMQFKGSRDRVS
jgi:tetratricopeptide (TPR) repeat protein